MKRLLLITAVILTASAAQAKMISVSELPTGPNNKMVFQLFNDKPLIKECQGSNSMGVLVDVEINGRMDRYGTGCWQVSDSGNVEMWVKRFDDGERSGFTIPSTKFSPVND